MLRAFLLFKLHKKHKDSVFGIDLRIYYAYNKGTTGEREMEYNNPRYEKQGIHVLTTIFTVKNGVFRVLLIKRKNEPYKQMWSLVGGSVYNDEDIDSALRREVLEKVGIKGISYRHYGIYSKPDRAPEMRMLALAYISVIDADKVELLTETSHTYNAEWFDITKLPHLAFDHDEIVTDGINYLREHINDRGILRELFPKRFTLPELHKAYECILTKQIDRRNFRKKLIADGVIKDTGLMNITKGVKSSKLYEFC